MLGSKQKKAKYMEELEVFIMNELPDENGWYSDGHEAFIELAKRLHELGMQSDEIKAHLQEIYSAVADEFGG